MRKIACLFLIVCLPLIIMLAFLSSQTTAQTLTPMPANWITSVAWNPEGSLIAKSLQNGTVEVLDANSLQIIQSLHNNSLYPSKVVAWSPDGDYLAVGVKKNIYIWDTTTWQVTLTFQGHTDTINGIAWSTNGTKIASTTFAGRSPNILVWEVPNGMILTEGGNEDILGIDWQPNGNLLIIPAGGASRLYDSLTGNSLDSFEAYGQALTTKWSPDGSMIASGSTGNIIAVFDADTATEIAKLEGHTDGINEVDWSPNGLQLASASYDGDIRIWDIGTKQTVQIIEGRSSLFTVDWSPDGSKLAYGGESGEMKIVTVSDR